MNVVRIMRMDDTAPATKADLKLDLQKLELNLAERMDTKFKAVHEDIDRVLQVLINVNDTHKKTLRNHERRITHLEQASAA